MKINLPYKVNPVLVTEDMCDLNGHMNVCFYHQIFEDNSHSFYHDEMGFTEEHFDRGFSTFTLEDNVRYLKEFLLNDKINIEYALYAVNDKLLHMIGCLKDRDGTPSAFWETILGHIDMQKRKTSNFNAEHYDNLKELSNTHKDNMIIELDIRLKIK